MKIGKRTPLFNIKSISFTKIIVAYSILVFGLLVVGKNPLHSQSKEVLRAMGWEAFNEGCYYEAAGYFQKLVKSDSSDYTAIWQLAESYRLDNAYKKAVESYMLIAGKSDYLLTYPDATFYLALMLQQSGDHEGFCNYINNYLKDAGKQSANYQYAKQLQKRCVSDALPNDTMQVTIRHLGTNINSPWSEFGAVQINDTTLWFSAIKPLGSEEHQSFSEMDYRTAIYESSLKLSGFTKAEEMPGKINSRRFHNGNICYDHTTENVYFSRCSEILQTGAGCKIMKASYKNGRFGKPVPLGASINIAGYSSTQPHLIHFPCENKAVLYFVSNRPGGFGGMDIWYCVETNGVFGEPVNCGSFINTPGNEVTPFYDTARKVLWFSSDWHTGYGGYDIFKAKGGMAGWEVPVNAGAPINSPANEYYFTVNSNDSNGYFTSNRPGSLHIRGETCCNDIYSYEYIPKTISEKKPPKLEKNLPPDTIAQKARSLLPLILYFHNDEPDPATRNTTSTKDYKQSLDEYVNMLPLYRTEYSKDLNGKSAKLAIADINDFFTNYVLSGYEKLERLTGFILQDLEKENSVQLLISGYCSPLSTNEYNINLARRRIHSLVKYLETANDGAIKPYIDGTAPNGVRLHIFEDPVGKEKASPFVSDNPNDLRNSVYSRYAAFERRIEISMYQSSPPGELVLLPELPVMVLPTDTIFVGRINPGEKKIVYIPIKNNGKSELLIRKIEYNDFNLSMVWTGEPLLPGEERKMPLLISPDNLKGTVTEKLAFFTNLPDINILHITFYVAE